MGKSLRQPFRSASEPIHCLCNWDTVGNLNSLFMEECGMTNYAAMGYALLAADEMRLSEEQKERLWQLMYSNFDIVSEEKAEKRFREGI